MLHGMARRAGAEARIAVMAMSQQGSDRACGLEKRRCWAVSDDGQAAGGGLGGGGPLVARVWALATGAAGRGAGSPSSASGGVFGGQGSDPTLWAFGGGLCWVVWEVWLVSLVWLVSVVCAACASVRATDNKPSLPIPIPETESGRSLPYLPYTTLLPTIHHPPSPRPRCTDVFG